MNKSIFIIIACLICLLGCNKIEDERSKNDDHLLSNNVDLMNDLYNYILENKISQNLECSEFEELDFETAIVIKSEDYNKVVIVSRDGGVFEYFNLYFYSAKEGTFIFDDNESISQTIHVKSWETCMQECYDSFKKELEEFWLTDAIISSIGLPVKIFVANACHNECKSQLN